MAKEINPEAQKKKEESGGGKSQTWPKSRGSWEGKKEP